MSFTLALCTYNRARLLQQALESLSRCKVPRGEWDLLVIDNNSTDSTANVVDEFRTQLPIQRIFEKTQGLSAARNRALMECRSDVLLFTDDDLRFDADWLCRYEEAFAAHPQAGWFGGRVRPFWEHGPPAWLVDDKLSLIAGLLVHYDLGDVGRAYQLADPFPFGASFALRRRVYEQFGSFRLDLGVNGSVPGRGEEAEYFERLRSAGVSGWYVGESSAWHWQDQLRFRIGYLYRYGIQKGIAAKKLCQAEEGGTLRGEALYAMKAAAQWIKGRGDRARQCIINMGIQRGLRRGKFLPKEPEL